jgi:hypothetical protein
VGQCSPCGLQPNTRLDLSLCSSCPYLHSIFSSKASWVLRSFRRCCAEISRAEHRLDFTATGPSVGLASRCEEDCKILDVDIVATKEFVELAEISARDLGSHVIRGFPDPIQLFGYSADRGGSVCLNSLELFRKWISRSVMLPTGLMAAD